MSQTNYTININAGQPGQLYDLGANDTVSAVDKVEVVPFGVALVQGPTDGTCRLPAALTDLTKVLGVSVLVQTKEQSLITSIVNYPAGTDIALLRKGRVWVKVEEAVTAMSPVFVRALPGVGGTQAGAFRMSADTATAAQINGCVFRTSAAAGALAVVEFNLPA